MSDAALSSFAAPADGQLILALSKGRIFEDTLPLLRAAGIEVLENPETSRKLILATNDPDVRVHHRARHPTCRPMCSMARPTSAWPARTCCSSMAAKACTSRSTCTSPAAACRWP